MSKIEIPEDLYVISMLWKERNALYLHEAITLNKFYNYKQLVSWRVEFINPLELNPSPETNLAFVPVNSTKALNILIRLSDSLIAEIYPKILSASKNFPFQNFFEVEGYIVDKKIVEGIVYVTLKATNIDLVLHVENKIKRLPKYEPFEGTSFEFFFTRYKGKLIEWKSTVASCEDEKISLIDPQVNLILNTKNHNLVEGDEIVYKARIGNFLSFYCQEYSIFKPVTIFDSIKNELLLSAFGTGFLYMIYQMRKKKTNIPFVSEFSAALLGVVGVYFNILSSAPGWSKVAINSFAVGGIYSLWGKWNRYGLSILLMLLGCGFVGFNLVEIFDKVKKILQRKK
jgi:hypothetical protein